MAEDTITALSRFERAQFGQPIQLPGDGPGLLRWTVAICQASGEDLGAIVVREGLTWAQEEARTANRGVHEQHCMPAWEWPGQQRAKTQQLTGTSHCSSGAMPHAFTPPIDHVTERPSSNLIILP